jgi:hypothetical protein
LGLLRTFFRIFSFYFFETFSMDVKNFRILAAKILSRISAANSIN